MDRLHTTVLHRPRAGTRRWIQRSCAAIPISSCSLDKVWRAVPLSDDTNVKLDEKIANVEKRIARVEHLLWAIGLVATVFGLTGAHIWHQLLEARSTAEGVSQEMSALRTDLGNIAQPIVKALVEKEQANQESPIVFSVFQDQHVSSGPNVLVTFAETHIQHEGWNGSSAFRTPRSGIYLFSITFTRDAYSQGGTEDDVYISLRINGISQGIAWAGQGDGKRANGVYIAARQLREGDRVELMAESDGNTKRHLRHVRFTGVFLGA